MAWRQRTGSTVCPGCGALVGVNDETCYNCGRRNPALWGFSPLLRRLGRDLGFTSIVTVVCVGLYLATLAASQGLMGGGGLMSILAPDNLALFTWRPGYRSERGAAAQAETGLRRVGRAAGGAVH